MTPQQRLQEAKDQAAKDAGYNDFIDYKYVLPASVDRFCESLYEAGKKEGDDLKSRELPILGDAIQACAKAKKEAETYRKALEEIIAKNPYSFTFAEHFNLFVKSKCQEALKP